MRKVTMKYENLLRTYAEVECKLQPLEESQRLLEEYYNDSRAKMVELTELRENNTLCLNLIEELQDMVENVLNRITSHRCASTSAPTIHSNQIKSNVATLPSEENMFQTFGSQILDINISTEVCRNE